ncbi:acyl-CoA reductase [Blattabacterium cuenoti]|uniref:acyl-CoA reductase n=1 Tax=Blattabacterium cuenoti TaxID=1653831 RepID=UPI00163BEE4D|nr:acyl-CoA reductase [Blattabacterium cuenoti]
MKKTIIEVFDKLGCFLREFKKFYEKEKKTSSPFTKFFYPFQNLIEKIPLKNSWFRRKDLLITIGHWGDLLQKDKIESWIKKYYFESFPKKKKTVLVVMPGNIPMVGFHDFLCVLLSRHRILIKLSEEDNLLLPFLCKIIIDINPLLEKEIKFTKNIFKEEFSYVIATGSHNTSRYFEYYFRKYPMILRKSRTSIAIIQGNEKKQNLMLLNRDIFTYSGKGCRSVGKIFIPYNYDLNLILEKSYPFEYIKKNKKYIDNYNYYLSIYTMNKIPLIKNSLVLFKEEKNYHSPISVVYYEFYKNLNHLKSSIQKNKEHLQCIIANDIFSNEVAFGNAQFPKLEDYADNIDTIQFLLK